MKKAHKEVVTKRTQEIEAAHVAVQHDARKNSRSKSGVNLALIFVVFLAIVYGAFKYLKKQTSASNAPRTSRVSIGDRTSNSEVSMRSMDT